MENVEVFVIDADVARPHALQVRHEHLPIRADGVARMAAEAIILQRTWTIRVALFGLQSMTGNLLMDAPEAIEDVQQVLAKEALIYIVCVTFRLR